MNKKEALKQIKYKCKKDWFRLMWKNWEWVELPGHEILHEARQLKYKITTQTFYQIRREILKEIGIPEPEYLTMSRSEFEELNKPPDLSIEEMVDQAIKLVRGK